MIIKPLIEDEGEFGWNRGDIMVAYSISVRGSR